MSSNDTRIQNEGGNGHESQGECLTLPLVLAPSALGAIRLRRRRHSWILKGFVVVLLVQVVVALVAFVFGFLPTAYPEIVWAGGCDLEITFVVTEVDTGDPIPGATVHVVYAELSRDQKNVPFTLTTDANGTVRQWCRGVTCSGRSNALKPWRNTFGAQLPSWIVHAVAANYGEGEMQALRGRPKWVRRKNGGNAAVTIPLTLRKLPSP